MKRILSVLLVLLVAIAPMASFAAPIPTVPMMDVTVGSVTGVPGETVLVPVKFQNVPAKGLILGSLNINFDTAGLEFVSLNGGPIIPQSSELSISVNGQNIQMLYMNLDSEYITTDGTFAIVKFKIKNNAIEGTDYPVTIKNSEFSDLDGKTIRLKVQAGGITVQTLTPSTPVPANTSTNTPTNTPVSTPTNTPFEEKSLIGIQFDRTSANPGELIAATLYIDNIKNFAGYQVNLKYDPALLQPVKNTGTPYTNSTMPKDGTILLNDDYSPYEIAKHNLTQGILNFSKLYLSREEYRLSGLPEESGTLAKIFFKVLAPVGNQPLLSFADAGYMPTGIKGTLLFDWSNLQITTGYTVLQPFVEPTNTPTTAPTNTPEPTATMEPTGTPVPTAVSVITPIPIGDGKGLKGKYFDNMDLSGVHMTRVDPTINFDWKYNSPDITIAADTFSVKWTGKVQPRYSGEYTFYVLADDGMRLWVDGKQLISEWNDHGVLEKKGKIVLEAGKKYDIDLEYYDNSYLASVKLMWECMYQPKEIIPQSQLYSGDLQAVEGKGTGLMGQYYDDMEFKQEKLTRLDQQINFHWGTGSPDVSLEPDTFSVRWSGKLEAPTSGLYNLSVLSDDGIRVWIEGKSVIDLWGDHREIEKSASLFLTAGNKYDIRIEYYENGYQASAKLLWEHDGEEKEPIPTQYLYTDMAVPSILGQGEGLTGEYFDDKDFTVLKLTRTDACVDFDWKNSSPDASQGADTFSVRWTGKLEAPKSGAYKLVTLADDGIRVYLNNKLVLNHWSDHAASQKSCLVNLTAGEMYDIKVEYYENTVSSVAKLMWEMPGQTMEVIPQKYLYHE